MKGENNMLPILPILTALVPFVPSIFELIRLAEHSFKGEGRGTEKKAFVLSAFKLVFTLLGKFSTGGQLATWHKIEPELSMVIDGLVPAFFPKSEGDQVSATAQNATGQGY